MNLDLVEVRRAVVGLGVPARVAHELESACPRLVARQLALAVSADHVRAGEDLVRAVGRALLRVVAAARSPPAPARCPAATAHCAAGDDADGLCELQHERRVVGRLDARDLVRLAVRELLDADDRVESRRPVAVGDADGRKRALDRVLDVGALDGRGPASGGL